jgi:hypothetical protein
METKTNFEAQKNKNNKWQSQQATALQIFFFLVTFFSLF